MEVKLNANIESVREKAVSASRSLPQLAASDSAHFERALGLDQALRMTPEVRPEALERARQLIGDVTYPPPETLRRIAVLLAMELDSPTE